VSLGKLPDAKMRVMVRTRFAPSPTGFLHIGSLRTAAYAYALAKHNKGEFLLRIEDTDQKREVPGAVESLKETLTKFGLIWDELHVQSHRKESGIYTDAAFKLVAGGHAFYCQCPAKNAKDEGYSIELRDPCRDKGFNLGAIKLKVPENEIISYTDFVHDKRIEWNTSTVYDATLLKSDGFPTYHLAAMTDDIEMQITHILRGHDWLPSTPIHLLVFRYLGGGQPEIGHLTDILSSATGKKLSKRRDSVWCEQFLEEGYLASALLNFVILLGWAPKDNRELFTLDEFVQFFDINGFQKANPTFFTDKLNWFNGHYIRNTKDEILASILMERYPHLSSEKINPIEVVALIKDRMTTLNDFDKLASFFYSDPEIPAELFTATYPQHLTCALEVMESSDFSVESLNEKFKEQISKHGFKTGNFFMDLRISLTGSKFTPPITESMVVLGKDSSIQRIKRALSKVSNP
jgi:glutamyl-tRNA synthetase